MVRLIVAGIVALISLIATATTAAVTLSQTIQNAQYVNALARNTTFALGTQEEIDLKLKQKIDALYETVQFLGEELEALRVRSRFDCHASYQWICVTPKIYNQTEEDWSKVQAHLQGIWHHENLSLDLLQLHMEIQNIRDAGPLEFDAAQAASEFLSNIKKTVSEMVPSLASFKHLLISVGIIGGLLTLGVLCAPIITRLFTNALWRMRVQMHGLELNQELF